MLEINREQAEEIILNIMMMLEEKVNKRQGLDAEEAKTLYNRILKDAFTEDSLKSYKSKKN